MAIAYVKHPVSTQDKKEYRRKGFKIIDSKFAPDKLGPGDETFPKPQVSRKDKG